MKRTNSLKFGGITLKAHKTAGFTLAEVLITLGIIGVVAAMTIPNLIANTNGAKYRSGFKKAVSTLSQAGLMAQAQYDYDFAGITAAEATSGSCASDHPESSMTMCAIFNGTLTGQTFRGRVRDIKRQANTSTGSSAANYKVERVHTLEVGGGDHRDWFAYSLADGSILAFDNDASKCSVNIGQNYYGTDAFFNCRGFIDVNGVTLPNKEVQCSDGYASADIITSQSYRPCVVKNNANDMTDVFPIVFHDGTVKPASDAAAYVLSTSK